MATLMTQDEINSIVMYCPNEDTTYPDPKKYINSSTGKCKYAYVTTVFLGDLYIAGAIVLANSIRKCGSKVDIVVMVTPDVSIEGKNILGMYFTHVIDVNYIEVTNWRTKKQPHRKYLDLVFTKFRLFDLIQYEKVLLIDADALVLKYPDHLFTLNAPAGCFLEDKELIITYDTKGNYVMPKNGKLKWYEKYCDTIPHGSKIPKDYTDRLLKNYTSSCIGGGLMLLEPKKGELQDIINDVSKGFMKHLVQHKLLYPEQGYLALKYSGHWTSINPIFFGLQAYPHYSVLFGLQYGGDKPFTIKSKASIETRVQYPDFVLWHNFYSQMIKDNPELLKSSSLKEANEMNIFFKNIKKSQSRICSKKSSDETKKKIISNFYGININSDNLQYYHLNKDLGSIPLNVKQMFYTNINDFYSPIQKLSNYFKSGNYYEYLLEIYGINMNNIYSIHNDIDRDLIVNEYIKCHNDVICLIFLPTITKTVSHEKLTEIIQTHGNIFYEKTLKLPYNGAKNLLFWLYDEFTYDYRLNMIQNIMTIENENIDNCVDLFDLKIFFIHNNDKKNIKSIKHSIKDNLLKLNKFANTMEMLSVKLVHVTDYFYQSINISQIVLNKNSIDLLCIQNVDNMICENLKMSNVRLQTFKKWIYSNLSLLEINRLVMFGSIILHSYGFRKANNINAIYINCSECKTKDYSLFSIPFTDFGVDIAFEGTTNWKNSWIQEMSCIMNKYKIKNYTEYVTNPNNYCYFDGFKCILLNHEITRKIYRNRNNDHADFVILSTLYPKLFKNYIEFIKTYNNSYLKIKNDDSDNNIVNIDFEYMIELASIIYQKYVDTDIKKFKEILMNI